MFVRYKIGDSEQCIQFDQTTSKQIKEMLVDRFDLSLEEGQVSNPAVTVSLFPPKNIQDWQKYKYKFNEDIIIYINKDNKFYVQLFSSYKYINIIVFNLMFLSFFFKRNIVRLHGMLLNNGDVLFCESDGGKSTLANRINKNNNILKCICDDGVLLDLDNNKVYPLPYFYLGGGSYFNNRVCKFQGYDINRIIYLKKDFDPVQQLQSLEEKEYFILLNKCLTTFLYHPFAEKGVTFNIKKQLMWINIKDGLEEMVQKRIQQIIETNKNKFTLLQLNTITKRYDIKFEAIPDIKFNK